jgi:hypothetical protein
MMGTFSRPTAERYMNLFSKKDALLADSTPVSNAPITIRDALRLIEDVPDEPVKEIKVEAYSKRNEARKKYHQAAIRIGELLAQQKAKPEIKDKFQQWMEDNLIFGQRMAYNYLKLYEKKGLLANMQSVARTPINTIQEALVLIADAPIEPRKPLV